MVHRLEGQEDPMPPTSSCDGTLLFGSGEAAPSSDEVLRIEHMNHHPPPFQGKQHNLFLVHIVLDTLKANYGDSSDPRATEELGLALSVVCMVHYKSTLFSSVCLASPPSLNHRSRDMESSPEEPKSADGTDDCL